MSSKPRIEVSLKSIRGKAKELGYKIRCTTFNTDPRYAIVRFVDPETDKPVGGNCYPSQFYAKHKAIFEYLNSIKGAILTEREQIVLL